MKLPARTFAMSLLIGIAALLLSALPIPFAELLTFPGLVATSVVGHRAFTQVVASGPFGAVLFLSTLYVATVAFWTAVAYAVLRARRRKVGVESERIRRIRAEIAKAERASSAVLAEIEQELKREPTADLWILRGDVIQLHDTGEYRLDDAEASYRKAIELDPDSADAYESLGHFRLAVNDDARRSVHSFRRAIELGAGESAREGLRKAMDELRTLQE